MMHELKNNLTHDFSERKGRPREIEELIEASLSPPKRVK